MHRCRLRPMAVYRFVCCLTVCGWLHILYLGLYLYTFMHLYIYIFIHIFRCMYACVCVLPYRCIWLYVCPQGWWLYICHYCTRLHMAVDWAFIYTWLYENLIKNSIFILIYILKQFFIIKNLLFVKICFNYFLNYILKFNFFGYSNTVQII